MTYSSGGPGYPGAQHSGAYAPTGQHSKEDGPSKLPVYLLAAVAVLGLAAYLLTFGPVWQSGASLGGATSLAIIAILFAALFAVIALLPKQGNYTPVVTATAAVGFLLVIWDLIENADVSGWALIAIVVVSALQTIAAFGALLLDSGVISPPAPRTKYDPYQQQYGGGYYGQPQHLQGPQHGGSQPPPSSQPTQTIRQPQGYSQYGGYPGGGPGQAPSTGGFSAPGQDSSPPTPPTGFPTYAAPPSSPAAPQEQQPPQHEARTQQVHIQDPSSSSPSGPPPS